jgi:hypothetical protein
MKHFLYTHASLPIANFIIDTVSSAWLASNSFSFSILINEKKKLREWLAYMALQCRCWFRFSIGNAYLTHRSDTATSIKVITANMIKMNEDFTSSIKISRSSLDEVINKISLKYNVDWSEGNQNYCSDITSSDPTSIAKYGEKEKNIFDFAFVTLDAMATNLRNFYLSRYKDRKKLIDLTVFLDNSDLVFGNIVSLEPLDNVICEIIKVNYVPGDAQTNDTINLTLRQF